VFTYPLPARLRERSIYRVRRAHVPTIYWTNFRSSVSGTSSRLIYKRPKPDAFRFVKRPGVCAARNESDSERLTWGPSRHLSGVQFISDEVYFEKCVAQETSTRQLTPTALQCASTRLKRSLYLNAERVCPRVEPTCRVFAFDGIFSFLFRSAETMSYSFAKTERTHAKFKPVRAEREKNVAGKRRVVCKHRN